MGYRSDVAYTIRAVNNDSMKAEQTFFTFLAEAKSKDEYKIALDEVMIDEKKLMIYWMCENIKWYDSFEYVKSHKALSRWLKSMQRETTRRWPGSTWRSVKTTTMSLRRALATTTGIGFI